MQKVFTASYEEKGVDESDWAGMVARNTKCAWFRTFPKPQDLVENLEELVYFQDIPFGSTSILAQHEVMKLAKENGVKVLIDGQGGDELFAGYKGCWTIFLTNLFRQAQFTQLLKELKHINNSPVGNGFLLSSTGKLLFKRISPLFLKEIAYREVHSTLKYIKAELWNLYRDRLNNDHSSAGVSLNYALHKNITGSDFKTLLRYEDRNSMKHSIEARTPFADDLPLIEYVFQIGEVYKIRDGWGKYLLREAANGIVPDEIRLRKDKLGFPTPEARWIRDSKDNLYEYITSDLGNYLDVNLVKKDWDAIFGEPLSKRSDDVWRLINFAVWVKVFSRGLKSGR